MEYSIDPIRYTPLQSAVYMVTVIVLYMPLKEITKALAAL